MKKTEKEKRKLFIIIVSTIAILIVAADLVLFWTSLQEDGVGRGFSRYFSQEK